MPDQHGGNPDSKDLKHEDAFDTTWPPVLSIDKRCQVTSSSIERTDHHVLLKASSCLRCLVNKEIALGPVHMIAGQLIAPGQLRACSHKPGTVNYPGVMTAPGQALPRVHMMICCPNLPCQDGGH